jgi:hypothetical protein
MQKTNLLHFKWNNYKLKGEKIEKNVKANFWFWVRYAVLNFKKTIQRAVIIIKKLILANTIKRKKKNRDTAIKSPESAKRLHNSCQECGRREKKWRFLLNLNSSDFNISLNLKARNIRWIITMCKGTESFIINKDLETI